MKNLIELKTEFEGHPLFNYSDLLPSWAAAVKTVIDLTDEGYDIQAWEYAREQDQPVKALILNALKNDGIIAVTNNIVSFSRV